MANGKSIDQIAEKAGVTKGTMLKWAHRAGFDTPRGVKNQRFFNAEEEKKILAQRAVRGA